MSMFTVTDLKQMAYCRRIAYYAYCLPGLKALDTPKMAAGTLANEAEEAREHRRGLRAYGLSAGERHFGVRLESEALGLRGMLDMLIEVVGPDGAIERIPVDYKNTDLREAGSPRGQRALRHNWQVQLAAYALLVEDNWPGDPLVRRRFIYAIPDRKAQTCPIGETLRAEARTLLNDLREIAERETMPEATPDRARCRACEFRRYCNDV